MIAGLLDEIRERYGIDADVEGRLSGGYECDAWALASDRGPLVVRVCPAWRTLAELEWAYDLAVHASGAIPEAIAPLAARDGSRVFAFGDRPVALFPRAPGRTLDRDDPAERDDAARLLARLHRVLPDWPAKRPRPVNAVVQERAAARDAIAAPEDLELDGFLARRAADPGVRRVPLHGDFYRGNLLVDGGRLTGLIDWDEARLGSLESELAFSTWELGKDPEHGDRLDEGRTTRFLTVYRNSGGPAETDLSLLMPLMRAQLRREVRQAASLAGGTVPEGDEYFARGLRAFNALRNQPF